MCSEDARRAVPRTDVVLADPRLQAAQRTLGRSFVLELVRQAQERSRSGEISPESIVDAAVAALPATVSSMRKVVNATGILVHTNLGRAPLSRAAVDALVAAAGTTDVELDLATGQRGVRGRGAVDALAAAVPDVGGVHVVNNCAAALALIATALAQGRDILISRGELVEIGDGFRIPELLASTGARLVEVGTTNRTRLSDYEAALGPETALILKVHPSNFAVRGFSEEASIADLATLGPPVVVDIGSGLLSPHPVLVDEPDALSTLRAGASLVAASGDKLLGGPQCGLLLGDAELVERLRRHPLARALRVDKLTLAALEATVRGPHPPVRAMLEAKLADLQARAEKVVTALADVTEAEAEVVASEAAVGGGGAPEVVLPSVAVAVPLRFVEPLRAGDPPVVTRTERGRCLLDLRTVEPDDDEALVKAVRRVGKD
ncbi:MAG: L-seryl-tRNA(Sec) selenium transferase [Propionibacteriales bacterium]|nr:L-seryl-tRNA(Sec) selenium transferase [Propionibacteriales bacterium]